MSNTYKSPENAHPLSPISFQVKMILKPSFVLFTLSAINVTAFPRFNANGLKEVAEYAKRSGECPRLAKRDEVECPHLAKQRELKRQTTFDPSSQYVSTTGEYAWVAPGAGDQRGPCPGLNALANHGYLPHSGVADIPTIIAAVKNGKSISFQSLLVVCLVAFPHFYTISPCAQCLLLVSPKKPLI